MLSTEICSWSALFIIYIFSEVLKLSMSLPFKGSLVHKYILKMGSEIVHALDF